MSLVNQATKLSRDYFLNPDVVSLARNLIGKKLYTCIDGLLCSGLISETEAYAGVADRASHAYGGRFTDRTRVMYQQGGTAYVYLCYGIHHLFNVVSNSEGVPHAILVRGIIPADGIDIMKLRRDKQDEKKLAAGPGTLSRALGIHTGLSGVDLLGETIWIEDSGMEVPGEHVKTGPRIGVDYAGEDALLPYRFLWNGKM